MLYLAKAVFHSFHFLTAQVPLHQYLNFLPADSFLSNHQEYFRYKDVKTAHLKEYVKYFNISFETNSPSYYPLECCLVNQLAYIVGEDVLFDSTINSNNTFKDKFIELTNYKSFMAIQDNIDKILMAEEEIIKINNKIVQINDRNKKVDNMIKKIDSLKKQITSTFIRTQNLITTSYFDKAFLAINDLESVENYRRKLYNFKDYLYITFDTKTFSFDFYYDLE